MPEPRSGGALPRGAGGTWVVLCTYNGAAHLPAQLSSIAAQSRRPDRVLVLDDRSDDATVGIAREFAARAPFPVEVSVNPENLGFLRNFEQGIRRAAGAEVVVLCDQDDVWHPSRLERIAEAFGAHPEAELVFSDAQVVDQALRPLGFRLWEAVGFSNAKQALAREGRMFEVLVRGNVVTGATMAFRTRSLPLLLPLDGGVAHDAWIALLLAALAPVVAIPEALVQYRQHEANQIGIRRLGALGRLRRARGARLDGLERRKRQHECALARLRAAPVQPEHLELLREAVAHLEARTRLPGRRLRRVPPVLRELLRGRYRRSSEGFSAACRDLLA